MEGHDSLPLEGKCYIEGYLSKVGVGRVTVISAENKTGKSDSNTNLINWLSFHTITFVKRMNISAPPQL